MHEGPVNQDSRGLRTVVKPADVMLIPRGLAHAYCPLPGHGWSEIYLWMRGPLPDFWWNSGFLKAGLNLFRCSPLVEGARKLCQLLGGRVAADHGMLNAVRLSQLQTWITSWRAQSRQSKQDKIPWLPLACRSLEQGTMREPKLEDLARRLGMSYESFRKVFAAGTGCSPGRYRAAAVIRESCRLLRDSSLPHKAIAARLRFADEFHFARTFRAHIGLSPSQYRAKTGRQKG
jgi:AraC-like DNA-binding protein